MADVAVESIRSLLGKFGLSLVVQEHGEEITGSFWGGSEAGIVGRAVYVRTDTPVHSLLHETCHTICMSGERRDRLERDAGGDDLEEAAVCYLQIVLAGLLEGVGRARIMRDMDAWGYSFRLGDTASWFSRDAEDARDWLIARGILDRQGLVTFSLR